MTNSRRLANVRACLLAWLQAEPCQEAVETSEPQILRESILIRNDFYCGRRFHTSVHQAVWFIEEDELKIYRRGGELACVLSSEQIDEMAELPAPEDQGDGPTILKLPLDVDLDHDSPSTRRAA